MAEEVNCVRKDFWFIFDTFLMLMMVLENWILCLAFFLMSSQPDAPVGFLSNLSVLRMLRMLKLLRLLRMIRLLKTFPELFIMLKAIASAARSVAVTLMLLVALVYVGGIGFSQLLRGTPMGNKYFATVAQSMNTLFLRGACADGISDFVKELQNGNYYYSLALFYGFVVLSNITLMNMLTGVLCSAIAAVAEAEKEALMEQTVRDVLFEALGSNDANADNRVERDEFIALINDLECMLALSQIGIDVGSLPNMVDVFFPDSVNENGETSQEIALSYDEVVKSLMQCRRQTTVTTKDFVDLKKWFTSRYDQSAARSLTFVTSRSRLSLT